MLRANLADFLDTLLLIYVVLIIARIVMSYFQRIPYNRALMAVLGFVTEVTDPFLRIFRRFIPPLRLGGISLDLSPIVAILVLQIVGGILVDLVRG